MTACIERREFLALLAGGVSAWPFAVRAQPALPVVGFLASAAPSDQARAFRQGLSEEGFVEGRNVAIEFRYAEGQTDRLPALAVDLARLKCPRSLRLAS